MNKEKLESYKRKLLSTKMTILNSGILRSADNLQISTDDLPDEADLANNVINQNVSFTMREREFDKLRQIEEALERIEDGTYGYCVDCDEEIEEKRLNNQPWTKLCIIHAEERERESLNIGRKGA